MKTFSTEEGRSWRCMSTAQQAKPDAAGRRPRAHPCYVLGRIRINQNASAVSTASHSTFEFAKKEFVVALGTSEDLCLPPANTKRLRSLMSKINHKKLRETKT